MLEQSTYTSLRHTVFGEVIYFFDKLGIYDIILPFLLVFTIVFAILERTKVLGTEEVDGKKYSKKNLNAMFAFVAAFLVVASSKAVGVINESLPNVVLLLLIMVCFLMLIGTFFSEKEELKLTGGWRIFFMIIIFIGIVLIFAHAVKTDSGKPWLEWFFDYLQYNVTSTAISSIILLIVVVIFMVYITWTPKVKKEVKEEKKT